MLYYYNDSMLEKPDYPVDSVVYYTSIMHVTWLLCETMFFKGYLNKGVNLEQRIKSSPIQRIKELLRLGLTAVFIGGLFVLPAIYMFDK